MNIYSDPAQIQTVSNTDYSVEELIEQFNTADQFGNRAQINQCIICAKLQQKLVAQFGNNSNSKTYKKEAMQICTATKLTKTTFNRNAKIGRYVMQRNDPTVYDMPKSKIKELITPHKPKAPRTKRENPEIVALTARVEELEQIINHFRDLMVESGRDWEDYLENEIGIVGRGD